MFIDGIVLHQLLQWHHMVSELEPTKEVPGLETNTTWDGLFHLSAWLVTAVGVFLLWRSRRTRAGPFSVQPFVGLMLIGWGAFHAVDQFVFHMIIGAHHIRQVDDYQVYDWSFFAIGVGFAIAGWMLLRRSPEAELR
jgi:uncharacterized membrane protein